MLGGQGEGKMTEKFSIIILEYGVVLVMRRKFVVSEIELHEVCHLLYSQLLPTCLISGRGGDNLALSIKGALTRTFCSGALDMKSLCIIEGKTCWTLYIDALILECSGNLLDAISIAVKAALYDTRLPDLKVIGEGAERDIEVSDDPYDIVPLDVSGVPVLVTLNKIRDRYVVDATLQEEVCSDSQLLVAINAKGNVCSTQLHGDGAMHPDLLFEMLRVGKKIGTVINTKLKEVVDAE